MRARQILQISGLLLLCLFLLSACDGCGPLDTLRVDSPLDESEITLPIQKGYGQLAGTSAYFRTKQTPRDLYQAIKRWRRRKAAGNALSGRPAHRANRRQRCAVLLAGRHAGEHKARAVVPALQYGG